MTQEQKDLLLKDLCARLPYGVKFVIDNDQNNVRTLNGIREDIPYEDWQMCAVARGISAIPIEDIKPYLFPLSSMTDKQIMESPISIQVCDLENLRYDSVWTKLNSRFPDLIDLIDWLNKNHFDYRGLIEKGLAIDATGKNIY